MSRRTTMALLAALLVVATLASYGPAYQAELINFDDYDYIRDNPPVATGLTWDNVAWSFTHSHSANWHPLTWISHMLDVELFGMSGPGHHAVNVLLHAANAVLLFLMLASLTGDVLPSFAVAALFALHPANVESVAWVAQRKTTLSTLFGILSIWAYARYARRRDWRAYGLSLACFVLSLMSKQMLVTMPFALLLLDFWPLERPELASPPGKPATLGGLLKGWWRLFPEKVPYLVLTVLVSVVVVIAQETALRSVETYPISYRLGNVSIAYVRYLALLVWPFHLSVFYPLYLFDISPARVIGALALLAAITAVMVYFGLRRRYLLVGWFWFLGTLVPVIGVVHVGLQSMADRYVYIPYWGLWIAGAWLIRDELRSLGKERARPLAAVALGVLGLMLAGCSYLTFQQTAQWHDTIRLFESAAANTERNWQAHVSLADQYLLVEDYDQVIRHCQEAEKWAQDIASVPHAYGIALLRKGDSVRALHYLEKAVQADPRDATIRGNLANLYSAQGKFDEAFAQCATAEKLLTAADAPDVRAGVYDSWAGALRKAKRLPEARKMYDRALAATPDAAGLLRSAAAADLESGDPARAIARLKRADQLAPHDAKTVYQLALAETAAGQLAEAAAHFEETSRLEPRGFENVLQWSTVLARLGKLDEAEKQLEKSLMTARDLKAPNAPLIVSTLEAQLATIASLRKDYAAAVNHLDRALNVWPENAMANNNLAWLLATCPDERQRDPRRALALAQQAADQAAKPDPALLGTLAAAQAAAGDMKSAVDTARRALEAAGSSPGNPLIESLRKQLELYEQGKPYVDH